MQTPLTQGQVPGRPQMYQGGLPGRSGSGFTGSFGLPTKVVRQTLGFPTNGRVNYTFVCRRFKNRSDASLNIGQWVFIRRHAQPLGDHRLHTLVNVPQLNDLLFRCAIKGINRPLYNDKEAGLALLEQWAPLGSVCTEVGYKVLNAEATADQPQDRLINATVLGRCSTFNCWGEKAIIDGCRLYMVLVRQAVSAVSDEYADGTRQIMLDGAVPTKIKKDEYGGNVNKDVDYCWQWRPYGDWENQYPTADSLGIDEDTPFHAVYVGRVSSKGFVSQFASQQHTEMARRDVNRLVTLPLFEVFVDYDTTFAQSKERGLYAFRENLPTAAAATAATAATAAAGATDRAA